MSVRIILTKHAQKRAWQRDVRMDQIRLTLEKPELVLPAYDDKKRYQRNFLGQTLEVVSVRKRSIWLVVTLYYLS